MGRRMTQRILECDCCGRTPPDGETMWEMAGECICETCINDESYEKKCEAADFPSENK